MLLPSTLNSRKLLHQWNAKVCDEFPPSFSCIGVGMTTQLPLDSRNCTCPAVVNGLRNTMHVLLSGVFR